MYLSAERKTSKPTKNPERTQQVTHCDSPTISTWKVSTRLHERSKAERNPEAAKKQAAMAKVFRRLAERAAKQAAESGRADPTANEPVISVDTKKKELVGNFKNNGREWRRNGAPEQVNVHDFIDPKLSRAVPYGVYDITNNVGWVSVGTDHDTATFAVNAIRRWWRTMGMKRHPKAKRLMITADGGGSNGYRVRLWKVELQKLADQLKLPITVCHLPPGTSKWNKIEHRLFSFITINWRGKPLRSYRTIVQLISATTTDTGLKVRAELDENKYPKGVKVSDLQIAAVNLTRHSFHGDWNYTVSSRRKNSRQKLID
jgi:hypothetical protein